MCLHGPGGSVRIRRRERLASTTVTVLIDETGQHDRCLREYRTGGRSITDPDDSTILDLYPAVGEAASRGCDYPPRTIPVPVPVSPIAAIPRVSFLLRVGRPRSRLLSGSCSQATVRPRIPDPEPSPPTMSGLREILVAIPGRPLELAAWISRVADHPTRSISCRPVRISSWRPRIWTDGGDLPLAHGWNDGGVGGDNLSPTCRGAASHRRPADSP